MNASPRGEPMIHKPTHQRLRKPELPYTIIPNATINGIGDAVALGVLTWLISKPENWVVVRKTLQKELNLGREKLNTAIQRLQEQGYWVDIAVRSPKTGKILHWETEIYYLPTENREKVQESTRIREDHTLVSPQCGESAPTKERFIQIQEEPLESGGKPTPIRTAFRPPIAPEVTEFMTEFILENVEEFEGRGWTEPKIRATANKFIDYYGSNGWKVGKNPMKDWRAALRRWVRDDNGTTTNGGGTGRGGTSSARPPSKMQRALAAIERANS